MTTTTPAGAAPSRPLRRDAARNREALLAAANDVFAERGLEASLDDIARRAGLGVGTAYRHFANKQELARALMTHRFDEVAARLDAAQDEPDALAALVDVLGEVLQAQSCDVGLRQVLVSADQQWAVDDVQDRLVGGFFALVQRAQAAGQLRPDVTATDVGMVIVMMGAVGDAAGPAHPDLWRRYFAVCLDGLCAQPGRGGDLAAVRPLDEAEFRAALLAHKSTRC